MSTFYLEHVPCQAYFIYWAFYIVFSAVVSQMNARERQKAATEVLRET